MRPLLILSLLVLALPPAHAQEDACSEAEPCVWAVQVDEEGLSAPGGDLRGTVGDWYVFEFSNVDPDQDHTIAWELGGSWTVASLSDERSDAFPLEEEGTFLLEDDVTGGQLPVEISFDDVADSGDADGSGLDTGAGGEQDGVSQPPAAFGLVALALLGAVALLRRR